MTKKPAETNLLALAMRKVFRERFGSPEEHAPADREPEPPQAPEHDRRTNPDP